MRQLFAVALALLAGVIALSGLSGTASAQKRVALVVGNSAYQYAPKLTNPRNDAADIAAALKKYGFQVVDGFDLDKTAFDRKVRDFAVALKGAEAGVLFYAGHGLQVAGQNYLVPIDAKAEDATALEFEMLRVEVIHRIMEQQTNTNILFLDACRDNPLARNLARSMGTRSTEIGSGLARIETGVGTLISFSTQPGNVALDGAGRNSPFAGALVKQLSTSNDDLSAILIAVRNEVMQQTQRKQVPWENSALTGRFYFNPAAEPTKVAPARQNEAAEAWSLVEKTTSIAALEAYAARFKDTFYSDLARVRIEELKKSQTAAVSPKPIPKPENLKPESPTAMEKAVTAGGQSAWIKLCEDTTAGDPPKPINLCFTHQERLDEATGMSLATAGVRQVQVEGQTHQHFIVLVPLGMQQGPGMRVYIYPKDKWAAAEKSTQVADGSLRMVPLAYSLCHPGGCNGEIEATPDFIADLKKAGGIVVYAINPAGAQVAFPVPLAGFERAYTGAPVDGKVYAEARKQQIEQLQARALQKLQAEEVKQKK
jgi:uncharacterized caspase-like protein